MIFFTRTFAESLATFAASVVALDLFSSLTISLRCAGVSVTPDGGGGGGGGGITPGYCRDTKALSAVLIAVPPGIATLLHVHLAGVE